MHHLFASNAFILFAPSDSGKTVSVGVWKWNDEHQGYTLDRKKRLKVDAARNLYQTLCKKGYTTEFSLQA